MVGKWEIVEMQPDSQVIILLKQEDFCGAIPLTYFVEKCSDLPPQYLRNEDIICQLASKNNSIYM